MTAMLIGSTGASERKLENLLIECSKFTQRKPLVEDVCRLRRMIA